MSRKTDLVNNTIRCITNIANTRDELKRNIQMMLDSGYAEGATDPLTDEELASDENISYLTYDKFVTAKTFCDGLEVWLAANNRQYEKILNQLRKVSG